jgi:DNA-binding transcriptional regulator YiaG
MIRLQKLLDKVLPEAIEAAEQLAYLEGRLKPAKTKTVSEAKALAAKIKAFRKKHHKSRSWAAQRLGITEVDLEQLELGREVPINEEKLQEVFPNLKSA